MYMFLLISSALWGAVCGALFDKFSSIMLAIVIGNVVLFTIYQTLS